MDVNWLSILGIDAFVARWRANVIEGAIAAEDRLELAKLELLEQKTRLVRLVILGAVLVALTIVTLTVLSIALMVHFWDTPQRLTVAWSVAGVWLVIWAGLLAWMYATLRKVNNPFALTRNELAQDWRALKERL
ncbi:phage holin family protein [Comamonas endophytica]|uniref:Phage holin family protein n=1 Tax=Comamonas endophytica TaxID=2949090 RepID=A0ABY6G966_9BURK|nr:MULTISPECIES: phage holin family protein [unclassified Acidovorax]MCD2511842.1 phage holin family protein [Acidovorax sp. D4N7]UYG51564.1 phage holin family protein [Acidovorax sp. 5MLIR]